MAASSHTVGINFIANATQAQTALNGLHTSLNKLGMAAGGAGTPLGGMAMSLGKVAIVAGTVMLALNSLIRVVRSLSSRFLEANTAFESAMAELRAVVAEDHPADLGKSMEYLSYVAREAGKNTRYSAIEAAQGLRELAKAGKTATESANMLVPTLHMAQLGGLELGDAAEKLADIMSAFGKDSSEATRVVDILAFTAAKSTTDIQQMAEAFKYVSAAGGGMGQSLEGISAGIGVLSGMGVKASMAGTALRGTLVQLADSSSVAHRDLLKLGLTTQDILPSATNSLADIMKKAKERGLDASNAYAIFGQRAGVAANVFTQFYERLEDFDAALGGADGAAKRMADTMDNTMEVAVMKLKNAWTELMLVLGDSAIWKGLTALVRGVSQGILRLSSLIETFRNAFAGGDFGNMLALSLKWGAMEGANAIFSGFSLVFKLLVQNFMSQMANIADPRFWLGLFNAFASLGFLLRGAASMLIAALLEEGGSFVTLIASGMMFVADKFVGGLLMGVGMVGDVLLTVVSNALEKFRKVAEFFGMDVDSALKGLDDAKITMGATYDEGKDLASKSWADTEQAASNVVGGIIDGLREGGQDSLDAADDAAGEAAALLKDALVDNWVNPMAEVISEHDPAKIFDTEAVGNQLDKMLEGWTSRPPEPPDDDPNKNAGTAGGGVQDRTIALAGAARVALNTILGRTANEIIAEVAADQLAVQKKELKVAEDTKAELQKLNEKIDGKPNVSTFQ